MNETYERAFVFVWLLVAACCLSEAVSCFTRPADGPDGDEIQHVRRGERREVRGQEEVLPAPPNPIPTAMTVDF